MFYKADVQDTEALEKVFQMHSISAVVHFAGLKVVGESINKPLEYYNNNVGGTLALLQVMDKYNCKNIVFSSTAAVYGDPKRVPIKESDLSRGRLYQNSIWQIESNGRKNIARQIYF